MGCNISNGICLIGADNSHHPETGKTENAKEHSGVKGKPLVLHSLPASLSPPVSTPSLYSLPPSLPPGSTVSSCLYSPYLYSLPLLPPSFTLSWLHSPPLISTPSCLYFSPLSLLLSPVTTLSCHSLSLSLSLSLSFTPSQLHIPPLPPTCLRFHLSSFSSSHILSLVCFPLPSLCSLYIPFFLFSVLLSHLSALPLIASLTPSCLISSLATLFNALPPSLSSCHLFLLSLFSFFFLFYCHQLLVSPL